MHHCLMNIKRHRKQAGMTQMDMARALRLSQRQTISIWESNPGNVRMNDLKAYAQACGVDLMTLLGYDGNASNKLAKIRSILGE